jgi:hypothetical protein
MRIYRTPVRKITHVDILFHEIMHSDISIEEGIAKCVNGKETCELICMLVDCGELKLDKFKLSTRKRRLLIGVFFFLWKSGTKVTIFCDKNG